MEIETLLTQLKEKEDNLHSVQKSFDEYMDSSKELEQELEASLEQQTTKYNELIGKKNIVDEKNNELQEKNLKHVKEISRLEEEITKQTEKLSLSEEKRRHLEIKVDELSNTVRILETTEEDLNHKLLRAEEDLIFLQTDLHELNNNRSSSNRNSYDNSEKDQIINRMHLEIIDLKSLLELKDKDIDLVSNTLLQPNEGLNDQLQLMLDLSNQCDRKAVIIENLTKEIENLKLSNNSSSTDNSTDSNTISNTITDKDTIDKLNNEIKELKFVIDNLKCDNNITIIADTDNNNDNNNNNNYNKIAHNMSSFQQFIEKISSQKDLNSLKEEIISKIKQFESVRNNNIKLLTKLQSYQNNIQVYCRTRPVNAQELSSGGKVCVDVTDENELLCYDNKIEKWRSFYYDNVWSSSCTQVDVFNDVEPIVLTVLDGYNACIMAYGQTGSGKTFTMDGSSDNYGVNFRTIEKIFEILNHRKTQSQKDTMDNNSNNNNNKFTEKLDDDSSYSFQVEISMMEIYNEQVFDLLGDHANGSGAQREGAALDIRQEPDGNIIVPGLKQVKVDTIEDVISVFAKGSTHRATAATNLNEHSSRSHLIISIDVTIKTSIGSSSKGNLFLVDLAGSEKVKLSGVTGTAMREAQHINKSLSALGDVMEALDQKSKHIPYRNSKLTFLLQNALGGNAKTMMIVTICPTDVTLEETVFALQFATRVRKISFNGQAQKNFNNRNMELDLKKLKLELKESKKKITSMEETNIELKRDAKKSVEKSLATTQLEAKLKVLDEAKRAAEGVIQQLNRQVIDLTGKLQEEKSIRDQMSADLELTQRSMKKNVEQVKEKMVEIKKLNQIIKTKETEIDSIKSGSLDTSLMPPPSIHALKAASNSSVPRYQQPRSTTPHAEDRLSNNPNGTPNFGTNSRSSSASRGRSAVPSPSGTTTPRSFSTGRAVKADIERKVERYSTPGNRNKTTTEDDNVSVYSTTSNGKFSSANSISGSSVGRAANISARTEEALKKHKMRMEKFKSY